MINNCINDVQSQVLAEKWRQQREMVFHQSNHDLVEMTQGKFAVHLLVIHTDKNGKNLWIYSLFQPDE